MAEEFNDADKTEEPTQKRLDEALKRGDVVKSQEVNTWFVIAGAALVLMAFSGPMSKRSDDDDAGSHRQLLRHQRRRPGLAAAVSENRQRDDRGRGDSFPGSDAGGARRQHHPAPSRVVVRSAGAQAFQDIAGSRSQADVFQAGTRQSGQGAGQARADRQRAHRADVAGARAARSAHAQRCRQ